MPDREYITEVISYHIGEAVAELTNHYDVSKFDFWYLYDEAGEQVENNLCDVIETALTILKEED